MPNLSPSPSASSNKKYESSKHDSNKYESSKHDSNKYESNKSTPYAQIQQ